MELQSVITHQVANGIINLEPKTYLLDCDVYIPSNVILQGCGYKTKIIAKPNCRLICEKSYNLTLRDFYVDADEQSGNNQAIVISNPHDVMLDRLYVLNAGGFGVFVISSEAFAGKLRISNCRLSGKGNNDVLGGGPTIANSNLIQLIITNNFIRQQVGPGHMYRAAFDIVSVQSSIISQNIIEGNLILGGEKVPHMAVDVSHNLIRPAIGATECQISILTDSNAGESEISHDIKIIANDIHKGHIYAQGQSGTASRTQRVIISDNTIKGLQTNADPGYTYGINLNYMRDVIIDRNIIDGSARAMYLNNVENVYMGTNRRIECAEDIVEVNGTTRMLA